MNLQSMFDSVSRLFTRRDHPSDIKDPRLKAIFTLPSTIPGITVTHETALTYAAIYACVRIISETIAMLPCVLYLKKGRKKQEADEHPLYWLLKHAWNPEQTAMEGCEMLTGHCALRGNAFAERRVNGGGQTVELWPMHPGGVTIKRKSGQLIYEYRDSSGQPHHIPKERMLHLKGLSSDGIWGMSPIALL